MPTAPSQQARRTLLQNLDSSRKPSGICPFTPPARALSHVGQGAKQSPLGLLALSKGACPCSGLKSGPPMALCSPGSPVTGQQPAVCGAGDAVACAQGM